MDSTTKKMLKYLILLLIGGFVYYAFELVLRGWSHWTMFLLGGICFILIGEYNEHVKWDTPLIKQGIVGACIVTALEFVVGMIVNVYLGWGIWDYSNVPLNFIGQICLPFSIAWIVVSILAVVVDDWVRYFLFKEEKPHYKWF